MPQNSKFSSPSALRNREPIFNVLREVLPQKGFVLEIASGSGEHIIHFAKECPDLTWQPSDPSPEARASIAARVEEEALGNLRGPLAIDTTDDIWPVQAADVMVAINMVHISPWRATEGLLKGAERLLPVGGALFLYGPYRQAGRPFVQSNVEFDAYLRGQNADWGVRQLEDVVQLASQSGLTLTSVTDLPANNLAVVFKRQ